MPLAGTDFVRPTSIPEATPARAAIARLALADESACLRALQAEHLFDHDTADRISTQAAAWIKNLRKRSGGPSRLDAFLQEYGLSSQEGIALLCLAEALLRTPDADTADRLIADKIGPANWAQHLRHSPSAFVNAGTWGLLLTGRLIWPPTAETLRQDLKRWFARSRSAVIRASLRQAMHLMGTQFVLGQDIESALRRCAEAGTEADTGHRYSFDMLGEAALTQADADRYFQRYLDAIEKVGGHFPRPWRNSRQGPGISVKLSALHPRFEESQAPHIHQVLNARLVELARACQQHDLQLTVDAEEADRLELSLDVFESALSAVCATGFSGLGLAVQAVQKRAPAVIDWLGALSRRHAVRIPVRLVKGAYWDTEIKRAQQAGLSDYPVFTHKAATDLSYLACGKRLLADTAAFYPMFATHNAHSIAALMQMGARTADCEFQRLHGMGQALYALLHAQYQLPCRIYAPVGEHDRLLPYLVRRMLENGANTSFVHGVHDPAIPIQRLTENPLDTLARSAAKLTKPEALFGRRPGAPGIWLADRNTQAELQTRLGRITLPAAHPDDRNPVFDPADRRRLLGSWQAHQPQQLESCLAQAQSAFPAWAATPVQSRAIIIERAADLLLRQRARLLFLLIREAGKTLPEAVAEWREAVDLMRYYAQQARRLAEHPQQMAGISGESNQLRWRGRGVFACISPWNFPLAIFVGQISAALLAGNCVIAKPAPQTCLIAREVVALLAAAGLPAEVLHLLLGDASVGAALIERRQICGVAFTGSFDGARQIARRLMSRDAPLPTLIAETGGQNVMIADSTALPEQLCRDVLISAFGAAGQRCSALRLLYLQEQQAQAVTDMLRGALQALRIGDPGLLSTDIGPLIDADAVAALQRHAQTLRHKHQLLTQLELPRACAHGHFFAPCIARVDGIAELQREHFGPILHIAHYAAGELDKVLDAINAAEFGLTLGVHSRIESTWRRVADTARVGNIYVNKPMTGAVVESQPFGGVARSGTGPKTGGPNYLPRFFHEQSISINTSAIGGDPALLESARH